MTFAIVNVISKQFLPYFFKNLLPLHYSIMNAWVEKWKNVMAFAITAAGGGVFSRAINVFSNFLFT